MFRIKKLYSFVLGTFLPLLIASFSVCLFIMVMQFFWKYVEDMVGKGAEMKVLAELFFYAANTLIPITLPLAILLASLMTFGNLGEYLELLAMKSSGISLLRIMKPVIVLLIFLSGIAFVFQNNVVPHAQAKLGTIVWSLRMKTPELNIPEGSFCREIPGHNLYVRKKDKTGLLRDVMIYDHSKGFDNAMVIVSDSGRLKTSDDKKYLIISLYKGESFQNVRMGKSQYGNSNQIPFQRQTFSKRDILIEFDSNFNMADESIMQNRSISRNIPQLRSFIRTAIAKDDSVAQAIKPTFISQVYTNIFKQDRAYPVTAHTSADTLLIKDFDLFYKSLPIDQQIRVLDEAKMKIERLSNDYNFQMHQQSDTQRQIRDHQIELQRKFTYSLACILFFFIGAPLGSIIRKGGLGMPAVLSVFLFILYYTIDTFGWKMARQGVWPIWEGMWLSTLVLTLFGLFLTYKAVNDSVVINPDAWKEMLQRLIGKREMRNYSRKEIIMEFPEYAKDILSMETWNEEAKRYLAEKQKPLFYSSFWKRNFSDKPLNRLLLLMNQWIEDLRNSDENLIIGKLMDYPIITPYSLTFLNKPFIRWSCAVFFPLGIGIYILFLFKQKQINNDIRIAMKVNEEISKELRNLKSNGNSFSQNIRTK